MQELLLAQTIPTIAVASIYCIWMRAVLVQRAKLHRLRERVAYMLWAAATETD
jgi:hypothetical protein